MNYGLWRPSLSQIIMCALLQYTWILPLCMGAIITLVESEQSTVFMWNKSNPMFQQGGARLDIPLGYNLEVVCPHNASDPEYYMIIWLTSPSSERNDRAFNECFRPTNTSEWKLLVNCTKPHESPPISFTQGISVFSGAFGSGVDFQSGHHYYITTVSTGTPQGISNQYEGGCHKHNMKINMTVVDHLPPTTKAPSSQSTVTTKRVPTPTTHRTNPTTRRPTTTTSTTTTRQTTKIITTLRPPSTDIPDSTDIVINVPDKGGNTGVIDANSATILTCPWVLTLTLCLSLLHILNIAHRTTLR